MVNHDIVGFDISMHDSFAMAKVQGLEQLVDVEANIIIDKTGVQGSEVCVVDVFEYQTGGLGLAVTHDVQQGDNVGAARQILQDFDFTLDFLLLDRFEDLDDTFLIVGHVDALKDF